MVGHLPSPFRRGSATLCFPAQMKCLDIFEMSFVNVSCFSLYWALIGLSSETPYCFWIVVQFPFIVSGLSLSSFIVVHLPWFFLNCSLLCPMVLCYDYSTFHNNNPPHETAHDKPSFPISFLSKSGLISFRSCCGKFSKQPDMGREMTRHLLISKIYDIVRHFGLRRISYCRFSLTWRFQNVPLGVRRVTTQIQTRGKVGGR
jgi:hypothetical protein